MNRGIVIFVSLAVLVAHSLAIRTDVGGALAPPYDQAFVAFRIARNLVFEGEWAWSPGQSGFDAYPSTLWVLVCTVIERLNLPINLFVRAIGVLATASSFIVATRFHPDRVASLITPMLLAISGAMAAAAVNGTETAVFTALVSVAFLAYERRRDRFLGVALLLCGLTRGEGWVLVLAFLAMRLYERARGVERASLKPFLAPLAGLLGLTALRFHLNGYLLPPWLADLVELREGELSNGAAYVRDFFVSSASPALVVYALWYVLRRNLSRTGVRALALFLVWAALVTFQGGGSTPFSESMVPVLPLILIAGQEGLITALNSLKAPVRVLAWASFLAAVSLSTLASFRRSQAGPEVLVALQEDWMRPEAAPRFGFEDRLGRQGLDEEAQATGVLRDVALFMRDQVDPRRSVLTPWPGSIAYLSSLPVVDLLGRATPIPPYERTSFAPLQRRVDLLGALALEPDYVVFSWREQEHCPTTDQVADQWSEALDLHHGEEGRGLALREAFARYEVVAVPLTGSDAKELGRTYLLRKRALGESPVVEARIEDDVLEVELEHRGHYQLGDLAVRGIDERGDVWHMNPQGRFSRGKPTLVRPNLLLTETGERRVLLGRFALRNLPDELVQLRVTLLNPEATEDSTSQRIAEEVVVELPG